MTLILNSQPVEQRDKKEQRLCFHKKKKKFLLWKKTLWWAKKFWPRTQSGSVELHSGINEETSGFPTQSTHHFGIGSPPFHLALMQSAGLKF